MKTLSVIIPGLLGPLPELQNSQHALPDCSVLNQWLARADQTYTQCDNYYQQLAQLFSLPVDFSIALASAHYDQCDCSEDFWYRADPVHFKADMDHALLLDCQQLNIQHDEALALAENFNQHFFDDGLKLVAAHADRWYLQSKTPLNINTTALPDAIGRNVSNFLPSGEGALNWRRLLNEAQMLFHASQVNEQREDCAQLGINSLWLWAEGRDSLNPVAKEFSWIMADEAVVNGLSRMASCVSQPLSENLNEISNLEGNGLLVLDSLMGPVSYGDVAAWHDAVLELCQQYLQALDGLLKTGTFNQLNLYTGEGRMFVITRKKLLKFWRRNKTINAYMNY